MKYIILVAALACLASGASIDNAKLLPAQPAELVIPKTDVVLNNTLVVGLLSLDEGVVYGLDSMTDSLTFNLLTFVLKGDINIPKVGLSGVFGIDALATLPDGTTYDLQGAGAVQASANDVFLNIFVDFDYNIITTKVKIASLDATPRLGACSVTAADATSNGEPIDFGKLCEVAPALIDEYWADHKASILEDVKVVANELLKDMTLADLIAIIGAGRVKMVVE